MHQIQRQQFARKLRPLTLSVRGRPSIVARGLLETILVEWTQTNFPGVHCGDFLHVKTHANSTATKAFVDWLSTLDFLEASFWLSSVYALWAGDAHRKTFAVFFTPPSLTTRLLDDLAESGVSFTQSTFVDPACGGAAFLAPIALRIRAQLKAKGWSPAQILTHVTSHVHGTDIDDRLCGLSRHFMRIVLREEIARTGTQPQFRISRANSLTELASEFSKFDVVLCNPPYRKMNAAEVLAAGHTYKEVVQAQPNLYGLFIALCVKLLRPEGHAALVTPTSFLTGSNFSALRKYLTSATAVERIGMVSDRTGVFIDVEQETALTVLRRTVTAAIPLNTAVSLVARDGSYRSVGTCALSRSGEAWTIPRTESDMALLAKVSKSPYRIADYGYQVRIGVFVWNRDPRPTYFDPSSHVRSNECSLFPLIWSSDIGTDFKLKFGAKENAHLEPSWVAFGSENQSGVVKRAAVLLQRVTSNDQPRRLVGAVMPLEFVTEHGGFVAENHVVVLEQIAAGVSPEKLARLLACKPIDRYFRCISGSTNVSAYELRHLPLPQPSAVSTIPLDPNFDAAVSAAFDGISG